MPKGSTRRDTKAKMRTYLVNAKMCIYLVKAKMRIYLVKRNQARKKDKGNRKQ